MNLGSVLQELGRFQEAAAAFRRSVEIAPQFAPAYVALGKVLERLGESDEAAEYYRRAIEIDPRQQAALESLNRMESVGE